MFVEENPPIEPTPKHDPWSQAFDEDALDPVVDLKTQLLTQVDVYGSDLPKVDSFFKNIAQMEQVLHGEAVSGSLATLMAENEQFIQTFINTNPELATKLTDIQTNFLEQVKQAVELKQRERNQVLAARVHFEANLDQALSVIQDSSPELKIVIETMWSDQLAQQVKAAAQPVVLQAWDEYESLDAPEKSHYPDFFEFVWDESSEYSNKIVSAISTVLSGYSQKKD